MAIVKTGLCHSIVDILLDIYEKKKDDEKFLFLCEKEFKHSYLKYIEYLETKGQINEAANVLQGLCILQRDS